MCISLQAADGTILEINPAGTTMLGAESADHVVGMSIYQFISPDYHEPHAALTRRVFGGEQAKLEFNGVDVLKQKRRLETHAVPMRGKDGTVVALVAITLDITEQERIADEFEAK